MLELQWRSLENKNYLPILTNVNPVKTNFQKPWTQILNKSKCHLQMHDSSEIEILLNQQLFHKNWGVFYMLQFPTLNKSNFLTSSSMLSIKYWL